MSFNSLKNIGLAGLLALMLVLAGLAVEHGRRALETLDLTANHTARLREALVATRFDLATARDIFRLYHALDPVTADEVRIRLATLERAVAAAEQRAAAPGAPGGAPSGAARAARAAFDELSASADLDPTSEYARELTELIESRLAAVSRALPDNLEVIARAAAARRALTTFLTQEPVTLEEILVPLRRSRARWSPCQACSRALLGDSGQREVAALGAALERLQGAVLSYGEERRADNEDSDLRSAHRAVIEWFATAEQRLDAVRAGVGQRASALQASLMSESRRRQQEFAVIATGFLGLALALSWLLGRSLEVRIGRLAAAARRFGRGELGHRVSVPGRDALAHLAEGLNAMAAERARAEERLYRLAYYDPITGLPNGHFLRRHLTAVLAAGTRAALLYIDIDRFREINDARGREFGDRVLATLAPRLRACLRRDQRLALEGWSPEGSPGAAAGDMLARLGGDEFLALLAPSEAAGEAYAAARRVSEALGEPLGLDGERLYLSATVGVALAPEHGTETESLIKNAEAALHYARRAGYGRVEVFRDEVERTAQQRLDLLNRLRRAVEHGDFELHYQPKVMLGDGRCAGAEALIRWNEPGGGLIPPDRFIPLAEETGLIVPIGDWVVEAACAQLAAWQCSGLGGFSVAINLCAEQCQDPQLPRRLDETLARHSLAPGQLEVEVTERAIIREAERSRRILTEFAERGIRVALDDFGTGYSSLARLKTLPLATLKIDRMFVAGLPGGHADRAIVETVLDLAHHLDLEAVAEGVEHPEQLAWLQAHGCEQAQGFLLARPLPAAELRAWLEAGGTPLADIPASPPRSA